MSRIGNKSIKLPKGVTVTVNDRQVTVQGAKTSLDHVIPEGIAAEVENGTLQVSRVSETRQARALQGLTRSLLNNMVTGVSTGFKKDLEIRGVGYRAAVAAGKLTLNIGYSHPVIFDVPTGISVVVADNVKIAVEGADRQLVGQVAATIRSFRPPEVYKGKGIRYVGEYVIQKEGKSSK